MNNKPSKFSYNNSGTGILEGGAGTYPREDGTFEPRPRRYLPIDGGITGTAVPDFVRTTPPTEHTPLSQTLKQKCTIL